MKGVKTDLANDMALGLKGVMWQDILTPGKNIFIFSRFGIKLRWKVSFALQFLKVKIPPHVHKNF
jgi:hypothetical protein